MFLRGLLSYRKANRNHISIEKFALTTKRTNLSLFTAATIKTTKKTKKINNNSFKKDEELEELKRMGIKTTTETMTSATEQDENKKIGEQENRKKRKIKGVIFDMDGTLTKPNLDFKKMRTRIGCKTQNILKEVDEEFDEVQRKRAYEIIQEMEDEALKTMECVEGAVELAKLLDLLCIPRALVTRNVKSSVDHFHGVAWKDGANGNKMMKPFHPVCSREFVPYKPAPDSLLYICEQWGVKPEEVMMVGDSPKDDVVAGNRAGCVTVLVEVENTHRSYDIDKLEGEMLPHFIVPRIEEIALLLDFHFEVDNNNNNKK